MENDRNAERGRDEAGPDAALEPFFRAARAEAPEAEPSAALMARILGDAAAETSGSAVAPAPARKPDPLPERPPELPPRRPRPRAGIGRRLGAIAEALGEALGGWPAAAGLAAVAATGVWLGYDSSVLPALVGTESELYSSPSALLAGYDAFLPDG